MEFNPRKPQVRKKEINLRKYLKKISLAPIQMHEAFCCPVFALYVYVFVFVLPLFLFFFFIN